MRLSHCFCLFFIVVFLSIWDLLVSYFSHHVSLFVHFQLFVDFVYICILYICCVPFLDLLFVAILCWFLLVLCRLLCKELFFFCIFWVILHFLGYLLCPFGHVLTLWEHFSSHLLMEHYDFQTINIMVYVVYGIMDGIWFVKPFR